VQITVNLLCDSVGELQALLRDLLRQTAHLDPASDVRQETLRLVPAPEDMIQASIKQAEAAKQVQAQAQADAATPSRGKRAKPAAKANGPDNEDFDALADVTAEKEDAFAEDEQAILDEADAKQEAMKLLRAIHMDKNRPIGAKLVKQLQRDLGLAQWSDVPDSDGHKLLRQVRKLQTTFEQNPAA
jgi:hypothetical protein